MCTRFFIAERCWSRYSRGNLVAKRVAPLARSERLWLKSKGMALQKSESRLPRGPLARAVAMALGIGGAGAAWAQTDSGNALEEIVVTATRRSENLQNVPIAIKALTGNTL